MPTKISRYCQGLMEAAWLAAVSIIPVFFNIYSSRIFEPDKITILRSLALLTLTAWLVKIIDDKKIEWKNRPTGISSVKYLLGIPLLTPVLGLMLIYLLSTIFSVTPAISFFGSYQRLQGTYTTFSYLVIFFSLLANLRSRAQINRLVTTVILASLPVSFYGLLQRYQIDPIPWGGDVSVRIASNMGNSIFVAAYLIMVLPLTLGRMVVAFQGILSTSVEAADGITSVKKIIRATLYVFIAALEIIAIYMSGSRGPLLGLLASLYLMILLFSMYWKKRWLTLSIIAMAILGGIFLLVLNINNGPLERLRNSPAVGRFGKLLDPESNSALVRQYIWEGTVQLVGIHAPLKFPDGSGDKFNFLRPLIGYGPETMYVAYNQFYKPELGQVEKRNASPDRAHNETWDSIVITGYLGLVVYLSIFSTLFYFGLRWLGLIQTNKDRNFFFICLGGGGVIGAGVLIVFKGVEYFGVGLPFGMVIGMILYLTSIALFSRRYTASAQLQNPYSFLLILLLSAITGHFVEINFGIAIVATRTLFWSYAGLSVVIGYILPMTSNQGLQTAEGEGVGLSVRNIGKRKDRSLRNKSQHRNGNSSRPVIGDQPAWMRNALIAATLLGLMLATLGFDYMTNSTHSVSFGSIIIDSVSRLVGKENAISLGVLGLLSITWMVGSMLYAVEDVELGDSREWLKSILLIALGSIMIGLLFWILHAISLATLAGLSPTNQDELLNQVNSIGSLLTKYYLYLFLVLILVGIMLPESWESRRNKDLFLSVITAPIVVILLFIAVNISNLRVIHADVTFKMAEPFSKAGQWQIATFLYKRSIELSPREDHYYLFLGRGYLEQAKVTDNTSDQDSLVLQAEKDLKVAQSINPLNTDHTANLARLYSWWSGKASNDSSRTDRFQKASNYYATAVTLSPNNSTLWDEWALLFMQLTSDAQNALERLQHALQLDPKYSFTQGLLGDFYMRVANTGGDINTKESALETAAAYYQAAAAVAKRTDTPSKASYLVSLGNLFSIKATLDPSKIDKTDLNQGISFLLEALDAGISSSDVWKIQEAIAKLYLQMGEKAQVQYYASQALLTAPSSSASEIQDLLSQAKALP